MCESTSVSACMSTDLPEHILLGGLGDGLKRKGKLTSTYIIGHAVHRYTSVLQQAMVCTVLICVIACTTLSTGSRLQEVSLHQQYMTSVLVYSMHVLDCVYMYSTRNSGKKLSSQHKTVLCCAC